MRFRKNILVPLICATLLSPSLFAANQKVDQIEAVVNQEVILSSDIERVAAELSERYQKSGKTLPAGNQLATQILDKLIADRLQLQVAARMGVRISDAQVNQTIQQIVKKEGKTLSQLQQDLKQKGKSYDAFIDGIRDELTINEVRQILVRRRINISDQEINLMVERLNQQGEKTTKFNFVHILLKFDETNPIQEQLKIQQQAQQLRLKIEQGENVNALAEQYSQGPKASQGGNWGWRSLDEIPSLFSAMFDDLNTKKGDIIGPFRTRLGLSIIKIIDKKGTQSVMTVEVNARHILIKSNIILNDKKAQSMLNKYRQQIMSGSKTFADIATEYSQDPGSAVKGGDLGWADPNMYVPEFRELALNLKKGTVSPPFHTMHGWHILEVLDRRESDTTEQATKQKAFRILFQQRFPAEVYAWINEIRQEAYIKINNTDYVVGKK